MRIETLIEELHLNPHPEGGYYSETYRSAKTLTTPNGARNLCTCIYYLLTGDDKSHFHRIKSDEHWFFHQGEAIELNIIQEGTLTQVLLGNKFDKGEIPYTVVPAGAWFAARIKKSVQFALVSCVVSPGFDFADFEMADRPELLKAYPDLAASIQMFTKD